MTAEDVYRADDMAVQRRIGDGSYVTIARGNTPDITSYIATALNASAADGRAAHTRPAAPPDLTVEWLNDDYVRIHLGDTVIMNVNHDDHGSDGMEAAIVAASRVAKAFGATVRTVGVPNLEINL